MLFSSLSSSGRTVGRLSTWFGTRYSSSSSSAISSTSTVAQPTDYYRITLRRSAIGLPKKVKGNLAALGLRKRLQSVYLPQRSEIAGMILAVKELVHVENVRQLRRTQDGDRDDMQTIVEDTKNANEAAAAEAGAEVVGLADLEDVDAGFEVREVARDSIWVNEQGEVVDWGGREARKAPRGYRVVGNVANPLRNEEIQLIQKGSDEQQ